MKRELTIQLVLTLREDFKENPDALTNRIVQSILIFEDEKVDGASGCVLMDREVESDTMKTLDAWRDMQS